MTSTSKFGWLGLAKEAIPGVMLGMEHPTGEFQNSPEIALKNGGVIAAAFDLTATVESQLPKILVVDDLKAIELLSWIHTYSNETFPLSQYCRVLSVSDWQAIISADIPKCKTERSLHWASVIAGEMLGQADVSSLPRLVPLGWAHSCLSYAMGRNSLLYGPQPSEIFAATGSRMLRCEEDHFLQKKKISASSLALAWSCVEKQRASSGDMIDQVLAVVSRSSLEMSAFIRSNAALSSSSAERRISGFDVIADHAMAFALTSKIDSEIVGVTIAAAAFLAGKGTSHIELIEPFAKEHPDVYVWFGLFAGIFGPKNWDRDWLKLVKGVERLLNAGYSLFESPQADLSWIEYQWLSSISKNDDAYAGVPKQNLRALVVEFYPGIFCQFRLSSTQKIIVEKNEKTTEQALGKNNALLEAQANRIAQAIKLTKELQKVLGGDLSSELVQPNLFKDLPPSPQPKKKTTKKMPKPS